MSNKDNHPAAVPQWLWSVSRPASSQSQSEDGCSGCGGWFMLFHSPALTRLPQISDIFWLLQNLWYLLQPRDPRPAARAVLLSKSGCPSPTAEADLTKALKDVWSPFTPLLLETHLLSKITTALDNHFCFFLADLEDLYLFSDPFFKNLLSVQSGFCYPLQKGERISDHSLSLSTLLYCMAQQFWSL